MCSPMLWQMVHFRVYVKSLNLGTDKLPVSENGYLVSSFPIIQLSYPQGTFPQNVYVHDQGLEILRQNVYQRRLMC